MLHFIDDRSLFSKLNSWKKTLLWKIRRCYGELPYYSATIANNMLVPKQKFSSVAKEWTTGADQNSGEKQGQFRISWTWTKAANLAAKKRQFLWIKVLFMIFFIRKNSGVSSCTFWQKISLEQILRKYSSRIIEFTAKIFIQKLSIITDVSILIIQ